MKMVLTNTTNLSIKKLQSGFSKEIQERMKEYNTLKHNDYASVMHLEYLRAENMIRRMIMRSEKTLLKKRNEDLPNDNAIKSIEETLSNLTHCYSELVGQQLKITCLENENRLLKEKLKYHGL